MILNKILKNEKIKFFLFVVCSLFCLYNCSFGSAKKTKKKLVLPSAKSTKSLAPEMVRVEGGAAVLGGYIGTGFSGTESRVVTINSFEISKYLITVRSYLIYLNDLHEKYKAASDDKKKESIERYKEALPKSDVWNKDLRWNDNLKDYFYSEVFLDYPVMVNYSQAVKYCEWLTAKEIEIFERSNGKHKDPLKVKASDAKKTDLEATDDTKKEEGEMPGNIDDAKKEEGETPENIDDSKKENIEEEINDFHSSIIEKAKGQRLVVYRLPTEAELEYAAKGTIIAQDEEGMETTSILRYGNITSTVRYKEGKRQGEMVGKFKTSEKPVPGRESADAPTEPVDVRGENGFGICAPYGNLWQWTCDVYSHTPAYVDEDISPCRQSPESTYKYSKRSPLSKPCRVIFGGSFEDDPEILRSYAEETESYGIGFRIVCAAS